MARHILPSLLISGLLAAAMSSGFAADPVKIRVASVSVPPSMHTLYMQVAFEEGIYRRNGLQVDDILQMNSGPLVTQALAAGRVDVADTDAEGVLNAPLPASSWSRYRHRRNTCPTWSWCSPRSKR